MDQLAKPAALLLGLTLLTANAQGAAAQSAERGFWGPAHRSPAAGVIQHVVFILQENRSFNNFFLGFKGAKTQKWGLSQGVKIKLTPMTLAATCDIDHSFTAFSQAYDDGKNDGWNNEYQNCATNYAYRYVNQSDIATYWNMAEQYSLADEFFQSHLDGSFIAHQYAIAAYANHEVNYPSGDWGCEGGSQDTIQTLTQNRNVGSYVPVCEDYETLGDELDVADVSWRFYTPSLQSWDLWSAYSAINHIYQNGNGPDWLTKVISPETKVVTDIQSGTLANMTWVVPSWANSDHAGSGSLTGPAWVASIVDAIGKSPFWNSTAIFITWDDWGGWYDPVLPIYKDYDGLGYRIPAIFISPYSVPGRVTHRQYEMSSILRFAEDLFGVGQLAASDARAADPADDRKAFNFSQPPRAFQAFATRPFSRSTAWPLHFNRRYGD